VFVGALGAGVNVLCSLLGPSRVTVGATWSEDWIRAPELPDELVGVLGVEGGTERQIENKLMSFKTLQGGAKLPADHDQKSPQIAKK